MKTETHHLELRLSGGIVASADLPLSAAAIQAIQTDRGTAARYAASAALAAQAACMKSNPRWPRSNRDTFAADVAACCVAAVQAM